MRIFGAVTIDKVANIVLILTCLVVGAQAGSRLYRTVFPVRSEPLYKPGEVVSDTSELKLKQGSLTLLMITSSTCHFCTESMPFYRKVSEAAKLAGTRMIGVAVDDIETNRANLEKNGVRVDAVVSLSNNGIRLRATPSLVLVKQDGAVVNSWLGKLVPQVEADVIRAVRQH